MKNRYKGRPETVKSTLEGQSRPFIRTQFIQSRVFIFFHRVFYCLFPKKVKLISPISKAESLGVTPDALDYILCIKNAFGSSWLVRVHFGLRLGFILEGTRVGRVGQQVVVKGPEFHLVIFRDKAIFVFDSTVEDQPLDI